MPQDVTLRRATTRIGEIAGATDLTGPDILHARHQLFDLRAIDGA